MAGGEGLSLHEAAHQLGVHYMTAYRYVRTGRLHATKQGAQWRVQREDLDAMDRREAATPTRGRIADYPRRLQERLLAGDEAGAWAVVEAALAAGTDPVGAHVTIIGPALAGIGEQWEAGTVGIGGEHQATAVAYRIISRLGVACRTASKALIRLGKSF